MRRIGDQIAHVRLEEHLGTGGMGDIFVGHDTNLDRRVAVKAIRPEFLSAELHDRLVREARLLSSLDHENICRIYELLEDEGETFLVLELIRGEDLKQVLQRRVGFRQKLEMAEGIAVALDVAHRNQIIHRDLKLENIMLRDDGVVKVLDFGVARSMAQPSGTPTDHEPTDGVGVAAPSEPSERTSSSVTVMGQTIGTVTTMSPEQALGEEVTAATDLYSLGLVFQELFTGKPPYPADLSNSQLWLRAKDADTLPIEGLDRELAALIEELKAADPGLRPTAAKTVLRLRAIRDRPRRRLRRAAAAALVVLAMTGAAKYTFDLRRERNAAINARLEAEHRGRESEAVVEFLVGLFEASDPGAARGRDPRAGELLDRGAEKVRTTLEDQPLVRARLMETIGRVSRLLGQFERAETLLSDALSIREQQQGDDHWQVARGRSQLGDLLRIRGRFDDARELIDRSLGALDTEEYPALAADVVNHSGALALAMGHFDDATKAFRRVVELRSELAGDQDTTVIAARNNLAIAYLQAGRAPEAVVEHEKVLRARRQLFGDDHPEVGTSLNNLAVAYYVQQDLESSQRLMSEALAIWRKVLGDEHPEVATAYSNLGEVTLGLGDVATAEAHFRRALDIWRRALGDEHPDLAYAWHGLGHVARQKGDRPGAISAYREAVRLREGSLDDSHPDLVQTRNDLAAVVGEG